jgi:DNA (cytosine-5)-methyltransferase 1
VSASAIGKKLGLTPGSLGLLAGCPPCQGFSTLRTNNGAVRNRDKRNDLVREMLRFVRALRPRAIMMENVPGLAGYGPFKNLCKQLRRMGYRVSFGVRDAARFGVPQRRKRLILLAGKGFDIPFAEEADAIRTVRDVIGMMPDPTRTDDALHRLPEKRSRKVQELIRDIPKDGGSRRDLPKSRQLQCHRNSSGFGDIYGRMAWDSVAPTITSGCFNPSKGRFLHPQKNRTISMREAAMLQSFPREYAFDTSAGKQAVALMIGNALPPEFVRRHAVKVLSSLKEQDHRANRERKKREGSSKSV